MVRSNGTEMESLIHPVYYVLFFFTGVLNVFYLWSGIISLSEETGTILVKRLMGLSAVFVFYLLYQAYLYGEVQGHFFKGIGWILCCWCCWLTAVVLGFLIIRLRG